MAFFQQNNTYDLNVIKDLIHSNIPNSSKHFFNLDTSTFGNTVINSDTSYTVDNEHPFLILKKIGLLETNKIEDRIQCIRYMLSIPYKDCITHTLEVVKSIQNTYHFNIYKRFQFWSTQDIAFKLHDEIIHEMHPYFFTKGLLYHYPLDLMINSAIYILSKYGRDTPIRQDVLDFIVDSSNDKKSTYRQQYDCAEVLIKAGEADEIQFGKQIHKYLTTKYTDNSNDIINSENKCIKKLRYLVINYPILNEEFINENISKFKSNCLQYIQQNSETFSSIFDNFISNYTFTFENFTFKILFYYVYQFIQYNDQKIKEFISFLIDNNNNNNTLFIISLFNTICDTCTEVDKNLRISLYEELKDNIFNRYNMILHSLPSEQKEAVIQSIQSKDDKMDVEQFLDYYSIEDDVFKKYKHECTLEQYTEYYNKIISEFIN